MKPPRTEEAIAKLLAEVGTLADAIGEYEHGRMLIMAKMNDVRLGFGRVEALLRELLKIFTSDEVLPEHRGRMG